MKIMTGIDPFAAEQVDGCDTRRTLGCNSRRPNWRVRFGSFALGPKTMPKSFGNVEEKLFEAEFFLERLRSSGYLSFEASCYFSAFVSAARSVTFALQNALKGVRDFDEWYEKHAQNKLREDDLSRHFVTIRNEVVKEGCNPLNRVPLEHLSQHLTRQMRTKDRSHVLAVPSGQGSDETRLTDAV